MLPDFVTPAEQLKLDFTAALTPKEKAKIIKKFENNLKDAYIQEKLNGLTKDKKIATLKRNDDVVTNAMKSGRVFDTDVAFVTPSEQLKLDMMAALTQTEKIKLIKAFESNLNPTFIQESLNKGSLTTGQKIVILESYDAAVKVAMKNKRVLDKNVADFLTRQLEMLRQPDVRMSFASMVSSKH